jgi:hypothetical protein
MPTPKRKTGSRTVAGAAGPIRVSPSKKAGRGFASTAGAGSARNGKFNAAGERVNGIWMASAAQAERYRQLLSMQERGLILNLRTEVPFDLTVNNQLICRYRADFCYDLPDERGEPVAARTEDIKGMVTPEFALKLKLFNALHEPSLSVIHVKGQAVHPDPARNGASGRGSQGWVHKHWLDRIPD